VQQLLDRCWDELDGTELNVKLTDLVRLMELKSRLSPAADAERTFWGMIDRMRHEELAEYGDNAALKTDKDRLSDGFDSPAAGGDHPPDEDLRQERTFGHRHRFEFAEGPLLRAEGPLLRAEEKHETVAAPDSDPSEISTDKLDRR
jgi:HEAT repeat protein